MGDAHPPAEASTANTLQHSGAFIGGSQLVFAARRQLVRRLARSVLSCRLGPVGWPASG